MLDKAELAELLKLYKYNGDRWKSHDRSQDQQCVRSYIATGSTKAAAVESRMSVTNVYRVLHDYRLVARYVLREDEQKP